MEALKYSLKLLLNIFLTFIVFRRERSTPAMRRFCFLLTAIIITIGSLYVYSTPLFTTSTTALAILVIIAFYFALSFRLLILTVILTVCLSMPGIYYVVTDSDEVKTELSMLSTYGSIIRGTFDSTTDFSSETLQTIGDAFDNDSIRDFFLNMSNSVKEAKASGQQSDTYNYTKILQKNLIMMLIVFSVLLSALTSYICVIFSHLEYNRYLKIRDLDTLNRNNKNIATSKTS
ncbi:hypothetical protein [Francisella frigiditurris]|uniref:Uncharacterized protein n=1 Tax=Francisella frigiditurris TaxID=1542390 RepID=A0A1J0KRD9_9GAMM|nr:hypothetical protein [Francisella frigiditurris]APC96266.1 hypothetical protein KX01_1512 [Francisella frigiditurris]